MPTPCEQTETIRNILELVSSLKDLPLTMRELRTDLKETMKEIQAAAADSREYRTLIAQNRRDIESLNQTNHEQWQAIEAANAQFSETVRRIGERFEKLEQWRAGLDGGKPDGLALQLESIRNDLLERRGRSSLWAAIPTIIAFAALLVSILV